MIVIQEYLQVQHIFGAIITCCPPAAVSVVQRYNMDHQEMVEAVLTYKAEKIVEHVQKLVEMPSFAVEETKARIKKVLAGKLNTATHEILEMLTNEFTNE
jgi:hypothetical protein